MEFLLFPAVLSSSPSSRRLQEDNVSILIVIIIMMITLFFALLFFLQKLHAENKDRRTNAWYSGDIRGMDSQSMRAFEEFPMKKKEGGSVWTKMTSAVFPCAGSGGKNNLASTCDFNCLSDLGFEPDLEAARSPKKLKRRSELSRRSMMSKRELDQERLERWNREQEPERNSRKSYSYSPGGPVARESRRISHSHNSHPGDVSRNTDATTAGSATAVSEGETVTLRSSVVHHPRTPTRRGSSRTTDKGHSRTPTSRNTRRNLKLWENEGDSEAQPSRLTVLSGPQLNSPRSEVNDEKKVDAADFDTLSRKNEELKHNLNRLKEEMEEQKKRTDNAETDRDLYKDAIELSQITLPLESRSVAGARLTTTAGDASPVVERQREVIGRLLRRVADSEQKEAEREATMQDELRKKAISLHKLQKKVETMSQSGKQPGRIVVANPPPPPVAKDAVTSERWTTTLPSSSQDACRGSTPPRLTSYSPSAGRSLSPSESGYKKSGSGIGSSSHFYMDPQNPPVTRSISRSHSNVRQSSISRPSTTTRRPYQQASTVGSIETKQQHQSRYMTPRKR